MQEDASMEEQRMATAPMHPLKRYKGRHAARSASQTPDADLLLLSIAEDTHVMRLLAEENQAYIRATMDKMNNEGHNDGSTTG